MDDGDLLVHPLIIGERSCGKLHNRDEILALLQELPLAREATHDEVLAFIDRRKLMGKGIGYIDAHLLAAAALTPWTRLWTHDKRLARLAAQLI